jgi:hypothetical protein
LLAGALLAAAWQFGEFGSVFEGDEARFGRAKEPPDELGRIGVCVHFAREEAADLGQLTAHLEEASPDLGLERAATILAGDDPSR